MFPLIKASAPGCDVEHETYSFVNLTAAKDDYYHGFLRVPPASNATNATFLPSCFYWGSGSRRLVVTLGAATCADKAAPPACSQDKHGNNVQILASDFIPSSEGGRVSLWRLLLPCPAAVAVGSWGLGSVFGMASVCLVPLCY